jgi:hypothetical protein
MLAVTINRSIEKPYIIGSGMMLWSWLVSAIQKKPRYCDNDPEFRAFLRKFQWNALLRGKEYALQKIYEEKGVDWPLDFS